MTLIVVPYIVALDIWGTRRHIDSVLSSAQWTWFVLLAAPCYLLWLLFKWIDLHAELKSFKDIHNALRLGILWHLPIDELFVKMSGVRELSEYFQTGVPSGIFYENIQHPALKAIFEAVKSQYATKKEGLQS